MRRGFTAAALVALLATGRLLAQAPSSPAAPTTLLAPEGASPYLPSLTAPTGGPVAADSGAAPTVPSAGAAVEADTRLRASAEYLLWRVRGGVPDAVRSVFSAGGINPNNFDGPLLMDRWRSGFRSFITYSPDECWPALEVGGFILQNNNGFIDATVETHPGDHPERVPGPLFLQPVIGGVIDVPHSRGVVDVPIPGPDGQVDLDPSDVLRSHLRATARRNDLWGMEANIRSRPWFYGGLRLEGLTGFRYVSLRESLTVQGDFSAIEPPAGGDQDESPDNPEDNHTNTMHTLDQIAVRNNFYGGQFGVAWEWCLWQHLLVSGWFKLAVGENTERITQSGSTLLDATTIETNAGGPFIPRPTTVLPGGLFTPATASGTVIHKTRVAWIPDVNVNVGYLITPAVQVYVGYNYLHMSDVARISGPALSGTAFNQGHLELHGLDFGMQLRF
jgi:hypothetical protein